MSLPFGVRTVEDPEAGHTVSAPARPMLLRKMMAATLVQRLTAVVHFIA